jgi:hypothetical protein
MGVDKAVQDHNKRYYDQKLQEVDIYEVGQLLLVYWATRQVGKAEKLIHLWQRPYTRVRHLTPLNYEVKLPGKKKTKVVHV